MECSCIYDDTSGDMPEVVLENKIVKANKKHVCCECGRIIEPGMEYEVFKGVWKNKVETYKTCKDCVSVREVFFSTYIFGCVWGDIWDLIHDCGEISEKQLASITPNARGKVCEILENMWEEEERNEEIEEEDDTAEIETQQSLIREEAEAFCRRWKL